MKIPDWLVYTLVLIVVITTLFVRGGDDRVAAPAPAGEPFPSHIETAAAVPEPGPLLPAPDAFDEEVLVQIGEAENGIGTAFAINKSGVWLTARHVVDGCSNVGLAIGDSRLLPVDRVDLSKTSDLALLYTDRAPHELTLNLDRGLRIGEVGFHVGFPQGNSGEASSQLLARSRLVTHGRYALDEPVLAWSETGRSNGVEGTLAGMSGGPVFDAAGEVIGVTVAESSRHGKIYTESPEAISRFLEERGLVAPGGEAHPLAAQTYVHEADELRRDLSVVKVLCRVAQP